MFYFSPLPPSKIMRLYASILLASLASSTHALLNCDISVDGLKYDLKPLSTGREHSVSQSINTPPSLTNLTWYINPCAALGSPDSSEDVTLCPAGTQSEFIKPANHTLAIGSNNYSLWCATH